MEYLIPGEMSARVREHFQQYGINSRQRTVRRPAEVTGYTVPEDEIHCAQFQEASGINEEIIARNARETDYDLTLIWDGTANRVYNVLYDEDEGSPRIHQLLKRVAKEFKRDIATIEPAEYCFAGGTERDYCQAHSEGDFGENLVDSICIHFNCARRGNRGGRDDLASLYDFSLKTDRGLAKKVRANPLRPAGGVVINDTAGQPVAEIDGGVIYILVNLDASQEQEMPNDWVQAYWGHNADVLERILREAIPIAITQGKKIAEDPIEEYRAQLARGQEAAKAQFLNQTTPATRDRLEKTENQIAREEAQARQALENYLASQREIEKLRVDLAVLRKSPHKQDEGLKRELENVLQMPHVVGISFGRTLEVFTDTIYIDWNRRRYKIGAFRIEIDFNRGVRMFNYTSPIRRVGQHPHILNNEGTPCFGNIAGAIPQMLQERQLEMLVTILIEYLQSYNPEYQAHNITPWPVVPKEENAA